MAGNSYIKVIYNSSGSSEEGRKLYLNIHPVTRSKGIPTTDVPIPTLSAENRILIPTGGLQDDFSIDCVLLEEDSKVAANINFAGSETDRTDVRTIQEQWDFLFDEIIEGASNGGILSLYELYLDWNDKTYQGWLTLQSSIDNMEFTGEIPVRLTFKVGANPVPFLT